MRQDLQLYKRIDAKMGYPEEFNEWYYKQKMPMMDSMLEMVPIKKAAYIGWNARNEQCLPNTLF